MNSIWNGKDAVKLLQNVHALVLNRINFMILVLDLSSMAPIFFSVCFSLCLFLSVSLSRYPMFSLFSCLPVSLSPCHSVSVSVSLCLSLFLLPVRSFFLIWVICFASLASLPLLGRNNLILPGPWRHGADVICIETRIQIIFSSAPGANTH